ncbi:MAG TPA: hypothetical protein VLS90_11375, partial [Thermodesulfobacteriota bacterium]|nr:hypothetical protein [Thermodesulfobacteriota bacterium]
MKTGIPLFAAILLFLSFGDAQSTETFRGLAWGMDKKEIAGLMEGPKKGEVEAFTRDEQKRVGEIFVGNIYYLF